jgi:uncharacterized Zn finger protein (UPF0148 family)
MKCKVCGDPLVERNGVAYCPKCKAKRHRDPPEIDPETGNWEGMKI